MFNIGLISLCFSWQSHIAIQEDYHKIPRGLLKAIAVVESSLSPYSINAKGRAYIFKNKDAAVQFAKKLYSQGIHNINVGCMQLHWPSHGKHFSYSFEDILDPEKNIAYAAKLLKSLYTKAKRYSNPWDVAVQMYNGSVSKRSKRYKDKVYRKLKQIKKSSG